MKMDDATKQTLQAHFGYSDEEMQLFLESPRNEKVFAKTPNLLSKTIIAEVVESKGCNSQHKVGDKLIFDGAGNLLTKLNPKKVCIYALSNLNAAIFAINEFVYAGIDPNEMLFRHVGCPDVGVRCGGWGHIVMEVRVEERNSK